MQKLSMQGDIHWIAASVCLSSCLLKDRSSHMDWLRRAAIIKVMFSLMDHWDAVLPNKILRVNNEDIIDDLEGQVLRMLDFLELPFEESCITFYETDRSVRTASSEQVRKPINKSGMHRWKPYAKHLSPLLDGLGPELIKTEDLELIKSS